MKLRCFTASQRHAWGRRKGRQCILGTHRASESAASDHHVGHPRVSTWIACGVVCLGHCDRGRSRGATSGCSRCSSERTWRSSPSSGMSSPINTKPRKATLVPLLPPRRCKLEEVTPSFRKKQRLEVPSQWHCLVSFSYLTPSITPVLLISSLKQTCIARNWH